MDTAQTFSIAESNVPNNGCDNSKTLGFNFTANRLNGSLSNEKILQLCSAGSPTLSRINENFMNNRIDSQSLQMNSNCHYTQSPSLPLTQSPTSFSNFPRFPNPSAIDDNRFNVNSINTSQILQPRLNPASRRSRHFVPNERKDEYYWQKRRKNNEAARKSREKRRTIDSVLEEKVLILSHENKLLRNELYALKVKYGEIKDGSLPEPTEPIHSEKLPTEDTSPPSPTSSSPPKREPSPCSCTYPKSPTDTNSTLFSPTSITLPKVNVILESEKLSGDNSSSARLVLSNLASGTLILSPINLCKPKAGDGQVAIENGNGSSSGVSSSSTNGKVEDLKEVEAANTLANLFRFAGGAVLSNVVAAEKARNENSSSGESSDSSFNCKEAKSCQNLPCKLRFKSAKID